MHLLLSILLPFLLFPFLTFSSLFFPLLSARARCNPLHDLYKVTLRSDRRFLSYSLTFRMSEKERVRVY